MEGEQQREKEEKPVGRVRKEGINGEGIPESEREKRRKGC